MIQVNWQEEADIARRLWMEAHKDIPQHVLQQALSSTDVESLLESPLNVVSEQTGAHIDWPRGVLLIKCMQATLVRYIQHAFAVCPAGIHPACEQFVTIPCPMTERHALSGQ